MLALSDLIAPLQGLDRAAVPLVPASKAAAASIYLVQGCQILLAQ